MRSAALALSVLLVILGIYSILRYRDLSKPKYMPEEPGILQETTTPMEPQETRPMPAIPANTPQSPTGQKTAFTNEDIHAFLQEQHKKMGIRAIARPGQRVDAPGVYEAPGYRPQPQQTRSMEETRAMMREMAHDIERIVEARQPPSIAVKEDAKPALLSHPEHVRVGLPMGSSPDGMVLSNPSVPGVPFQEIRLQGTVARSSQELQTLWKRLKTDQPLPEVDFDKEMLLAVYAAPESSGYPVEIVSVSPVGEHLIAAYRRNPKAAADKKWAANYQTRIVERTDFPVVFQDITAP